MNNTKLEKRIEYSRHELLLAIITILLFSMQLYAGERFEFYNGVRGLGMGGTSVAVVNDETALIQNPAALGKLRDYFFTVVDPEVDVGSDTQAIVGTDVLAFKDPQEALDKVKAKPARRLYERAQIFPSAVFPNFGVGLFMKYEASGFIDETTNKFNYNYTNDMAAVLGANLRLLDGMVKIGANVRAVDRTTVRKDDIDLTSTNLTMGSLAKEGFGFATDIGILLAAPIDYLPTLGIVYRDAGNTRYNINHGNNLSTTERPDATPATLDVGVAMFPIVGKTTRWTLTAELKDVLVKAEPSDEDDINRRIHAGMEFNFSDIFFMRAGYNQRYWTAGFELSMFNYQLQIASYGEDVGTKDDPLEDRRYVAKFAYRF